jgi:hypothetical protein
MGHLLTVRALQSQLTEQALQLEDHNILLPGRCKTVQATAPKCPCCPGPSSHGLPNPGHKASSKYLGLGHLAAALAPKKNQFIAFVKEISGK